MPSVATAIREGRRAIVALEPAMVDAMLGHYEIAWTGVERELTVLESQIDAAKARREKVSPSWVKRQDWYRERLWSIEREMARFSLNAADTLVQAQVGAVRTAATTGSRVAAAIGTPFRGTINAGAMERWVSMLQPESPLRGVLDRYGDRIGTAIEHGISEGMGAGRGSREITRSIVQAVGPDAVEGRIATLTRTESLRSYRGALSDQLQPMKDAGIITGWYWLCAKSARTCLACLARDGQFFEQYPTGFHPACRCVGRPAINPAIIPLSRQKVETGADWFARQSAATQRKMLRTPERYDAYQAGMPLADMVGVRSNKTWGDSVYVKPMRRAA